MDLRLSSYREITHPVVDPLADVKQQIIDEVVAKKAKRVTVNIGRVLTDKELDALDSWSMSTDWWLDAKPGTDSTKLTLRYHESIMAD